MAQISHHWQPIEDLPEDWKSLVDEQVYAVIRAWQEQADKLRARDSYTRFLMELRRQWAIETGALERLYSISEGATKTLIEKGLDAALISHSDTDKPVEHVLDMIQDQHTTIDGLYQLISDKRQLSISYVRELHQVITAHQDTYDARDPSGGLVQPKMIRGEWKKWPNNVEGPDNFVFEFCPPEQVDSEIERLVAMHKQHREMQVPPEVEAAWLHHRFTLIHPFVDGNGRVARCLATLVFLRAEWFPLVITRKDKADYITALREADQGDLKPFITFMADLQRKAVRQAWSLSEEVEQVDTEIQSILVSVSQKFTRRKQEILRQFGQAVGMADALFALTKSRLGEIASDVSAVISKENSDYKAYVLDAKRGGKKAEYYRWQIIECAKELDYYANFQTHPSWVAIRIDTGVKVEILFSFHGIGQEWSGVLACSAMVYRREVVDAESGKTEAVDLKSLASAPFEITFTDAPTKIERRFRKWLEDRLILGLNYWQRTV